MGLCTQTEAKGQPDHADPKQGLAGFPKTTAEFQPCDNQNSGQKGGVIETANDLWVLEINPLAAVSDEQKGDNSESVTEHFALN